jgi:hypothetical protein
MNDEKYLEPIRSMAASTVLKGKQDRQIGPNADSM